MTDVFGVFVVSDVLNDKDLYALTPTGTMSNIYYLYFIIKNIFASFN